MIALGIDIGGSAVKAGLVDITGAVLASTSVETPTTPQAGPEGFLQAALTAAHRALELAGLEKRHLRGAGVGVPGIVRATQGVVVQSANLPGFANLPVADILGKGLELPVFLANDANAAALGESRFGHHGRVDDLVLFTLGTGIGGGLVLGGKIITGQNGFAGELGHMRIEMSAPRPCGCGRWGCLEAYAGGKSLVKRAHEALAEDWKKLSSLHACAEAGQLNAEAVFAAVNDPLAIRLVDETALALAVGVVNLLHLLDPDLVLLAGGMTRAGAGFLGKITTFAAELAIPGVPMEGRIRYASLGDQAGMMGAAALALQA